MGECVLVLALNIASGTLGEIRDVSLLTPSWRSHRLFRRVAARAPALHVHGHGCSFRVAVSSFFDSEANVCHRSSSPDGNRSAASRDRNRVEGAGLCRNANA